MEVTLGTAFRLVKFYGLPLYGRICEEVAPAPQLTLSGQLLLSTCPGP